MSDVRDPKTDQQLPVVTAEPYIQDLVMADLEKRKQHGIRKYGTALQASNGRDHLQDLYEELMDAVVYVRAELERRRMSGQSPSAPTAADEA